MTGHVVWFASSTHPAPTNAMTASTTAQSSVPTLSAPLRARTAGGEGQCTLDWPPPTEERRLGTYTGENTRVLTSPLLLETPPKCLRIDLRAFQTDPWLGNPHSKSCIHPSSYFSRDLTIIHSLKAMIQRCKGWMDFGQRVQHASWAVLDEYFGIRTENWNAQIGLITWAVRVWVIPNKSWFYCVGYVQIYYYYHSLRPQRNVPELSMFP